MTNWIVRLHDGERVAVQANHMTLEDGIIRFYNEKDHKKYLIFMAAHSEWSTVRQVDEDMTSKDAHVLPKYTWASENPEHAIKLYNEEERHGST